MPRPICKPTPQPHAALRHRVTELERRCDALVSAVAILADRVTALEAANVDPQATKLSVKVGEQIPILKKE